MRQSGNPGASSIFHIGPIKQKKISTFGKKEMKKRKNETEQNNVCLCV